MKSQNSKIKLTNSRLKLKSYPNRMSQSQRKLQKFKTYRRNYWKNKKLYCTKEKFATTYKRKSRKKCKDLRTYLKALTRITTPLANLALKRQLQRPEKSLPQIWASQLLTPLKNRNFPNCGLSWISSKTCVKLFKCEDWRLLFTLLIEWYLLIIICFKFEIYWKNGKSQIWH